MDIVITGANGAVGTALIQYLSEGAPMGAARLRALVRSPAGARSLHALGAEVIVVDYRQPEALRGAVAGADVAVHLAGALGPRRGETLLQANVETTRALVEAATSAGVSKRFSGLILALTNSVLSYVGVVGQLRKVAKHGRNFPRAFYHRMSRPPGLCRRSDWLGEKFPVPARLVL